MQLRIHRVCWRTGCWGEFRPKRKYS